MNGFVATATIRHPASLAAVAIIGAAPVPVPPPSPNVRNIISASFTTSFIDSMDFSAAILPISGSDPAPRPLSPSNTFLSAIDIIRTWASVFIATNSHPLKLSSIILLIALLPPPPIPITLITA
ncbi:hypothetical protein ES703_88119 [subsurface metagenome]